MRSLSALSCGIVIAVSVSTLVGARLAHAQGCNPRTHPCNNHAHLPYVRVPPPATATPVPTRTPVPSPTPPSRMVCENRIADGSFEEGGDRWSQRGGVTLVTVRGGSHSGGAAALFGGENNVQQVLVSDATMYTITDDVLDSATLRYAVMAASDETSAARYDELEVAIFNWSEASNEIVQVAVYDNVWANANEAEWRYFTRDVTAALTRRAGWDAAGLGFGASTDGSAPTAWLVDSVDLHICYLASGAKVCETRDLLDGSGERPAHARSGAVPPGASRWHATERGLARDAWTPRLAGIGGRLVGR